MDFSIKAGDSLPVLKAFLKDETGGALDLSLASDVSMRVRQVVSSGTAAKWLKACAVTDPKGGRVEFRWTAADTATAGKFEAEFVITWQDGRMQTVPNVGSTVIVISPTLA